METTKRYSIKSILLTIAWIIIGCGTTVLLVAGMREKDAGKCKAVEIEISGVKDNWFVDKTDVLNTIMQIANGDPKGKSIGSFNLKAMETTLEKSTWIKAAELFFDNNNVLRVNILEREPIARIFTTSGTTFYIDSSIKILPLSEKFSARLPVFTSFPSDKAVLSSADSNLLRSICRLSMAIQADSFRTALIDQVDITPERNFEMIPKIGNQVIVFGDAADAEKKFDKLEKFYRIVMSKVGWSKYGSINVQYKNQVVAKLRGAEEKTSDSLRTLQIMQLMADQAERRSQDSVAALLPDNDRTAGTDSSMIQESIQRDENSEDAFIPAGDNKPAAPVAPKPVTADKPAPKPQNNRPVEKPAVKKPVTKPAAKPAAKPAEKPKPKPAAKKPTPAKPRSNDY